MLIQLVKFESDNCNNCKIMGKILDDLGAKYESTNVIQNIKQARELGIRSVPVLMFMSGEKEIARYTGSSTDKEGLKKFLEYWINTNPQEAP